ncbi:MAG: hypothetical protein AAB346_04050 [Pseudomonadota bacterium]
MEATHIKLLGGESSAEPMLPDRPKARVLDFRPFLRRQGFGAGWSGRGFRTGGESGMLPRLTLPGREPYFEPQDAKDTPKKIKIIEKKPR